MSDTLLRSKLIRLAHSNPAVRADVLALLKTAGCEKLPEGGMRDNCEKKKEEGKENKGKEAHSQKRASPDYNWWDKNGSSFKAATTRAMGLLKTNPQKALEAADKLFALMDAHGYPDNWHRVKVLKDDAEMAVARNGDRWASTSRKAHGPVAIRQPEVMLYAIDASASAHGQSKFYELKVVPFGTVVDVTRPTVMKEKDFRGPLRGAGGFTLVKRWGRLTDSGSPARVDGMNEYYDVEADARAAMQDTKHGKMRGSGSARYTDVSRNREYPIGLGGSGFGWGGQQACNYVPELRELTQAVTAMNSAISRTAPSMEGLARKNSDVGRRVSALIGELQGTLGSLESYLNNQMSHCG